MVTVGEIKELGCPWLFFSMGHKAGTREYASNVLAWFKSEFPDAKWEIVNDGGWHWVHEVTEKSLDSEIAKV